MCEATISQHIRELEAELGVSLFEREGRTLKLAPEGEQLLPFIQHILQAKRVGHSPQIEAPDKTASLILNFIQQK